ncbi:MAG: CobW family GTP-binding protein [Brevibacterium sp.]
MRPIPLTVIGGYLGSGKTTLLNEILTRTDSERVAVLVNDFGSISIDAEILGPRNGRMWEIANGCICCDLADGMAAAIASIRETNPAPSHVFVEVSGVGQPDIVARWGDHPGFVRGGATVCVDVLATRRNARRKWVGETVLSQLRSADRLLLTKTDLASADEIAETREWLESIPEIDAKIVDRSTVVNSSRLPGQRPPTDPMTHAASTDSNRRGQIDDNAEHTSWTLVTGQRFPSEEIRCLLSDLPNYIVRVKGILRDGNRSGAGGTFVVQYDGNNLSVECPVNPNVSVGNSIHRSNHAGSIARSEPSPGRIVIIAEGTHTEIPAYINSLAQRLGGRVEH